MLEIQLLRTKVEASTKLWLRESIAFQMTMLGRWAGSSKGQLLQVKQLDRPFSVSLPFEPDLWGPT